MLLLRVDQSSIISNVIAESNKYIIPFDQNKLDNEPIELMQNNPIATKEAI